MIDKKNIRIVIWMLLLVGTSVVPYIFNIAAFCNSAGWAPQGTLTAMYADKFIDYRQFIVAKYALYFFASF